MYRIIVLCLATLLVLASCRGTNDNNRGNNGGGEITISLTDGPVENALDVNVRVLSVIIGRDDGDPIQFDVSDLDVIDLVELDGDESEELVDEGDLPPGRYNSITLVLDESMLSIRSENGRQDPLILPPEEVSNLTVPANFLIEADDEEDFTIDIDLRKSIRTGPMNTFEFRPRVRAIRTMDSGTITGTVSRQLLDRRNCDDLNERNDNVVYLFDGSGAVVTDIRDVVDDAVSTALAESMSGSSDLTFTFGFVPFGNYTLAFTCNAVLDEPGRVDTDVIFSDPMDITVNRGMTVSVSIQ